MIHRGILIKSGNHLPEDEKELYKPKSAFKNSFDPLTLLRDGDLGEGCTVVTGFMKKVWHHQLNKSSDC